MQYNRKYVCPKIIRPHSTVIQFVQFVQNMCTKHLETDKLFSMPPVLELKRKHVLANHSTNAVGPQIECHHLDILITVEGRWWLFVRPSFSCATVWLFEGRLHFSAQNKISLFMCPQKWLPIRDTLTREQAIHETRLSLSCARESWNHENVMRYRNDRSGCCAVIVKKDTSGLWRSFHHKFYHKLSWLIWHCRWSQWIS